MKSISSDAPTTRGVLFVHSAPSAMCPHVEWAAANVLGDRVDLAWSAQPADPGTYRAELSWQAPVGTGATLASALRGWDLLRYEVTEEPTGGSEGARFSFTPELGIFHAVVGVHGDLMIPEDRIRAMRAKAAAGEVSMDEALDGLLGASWDAALEPFRHAGDGAPVRWLHQVI